MKTLPSNKKEINNQLLAELKLSILPSIHHYYEENIQNEKMVSLKNIEPLFKIIIQYYDFSLNSFVLYREIWNKYIEFVNNCPKNKDGSTSFGGKDLRDRYNALGSQETLTYFGIYVYGNVCLKVLRKLKEYALEFSDSEITRKIKEIAKKNEKKARQFTEIRNLVVIHPLVSEESGFPDRYICFQKDSSSWKHSDTEVTFKIISLAIPHLSKEIILHPYQDLRFVKDYTEEMGQILGKFFAKDLDPHIHL